MRILLLTILGLMLLASVPAEQSTSKPIYEVYAISYAVIPDFPVASLVAGADRSRNIDIQMMVWLLKGFAGAKVQRFKGSRKPTGSRGPKKK